MTEIDFIMNHEKHKITSLDKKFFVKVSKKVLLYISFIINYYIYITIFNSRKTEMMMTVTKLLTMTVTMKKNKKPSK